MGTLNATISKLKSYPRWLLNTFSQTTSTLTPMVCDSPQHTWPCMASSICLNHLPFTCVYVCVCVNMVHHKINMGEREGCVIQFFDMWKYRWDEKRIDIKLQWDGYIWRVVNCEGGLTPLLPIHRLHQHDFGSPLRLWKLWPKKIHNIWHVTFLDWTTWMIGLFRWEVPTFFLYLHLI
jgi:hypothetical protein